MTDRGEEKNGEPTTVSPAGCRREAVRAWRGKGLKAAPFWGKSLRTSHLGLARPLARAHNEKTTHEDQR
jgi:hypothetical protein